MKVTSIYNQANDIEFLKYLVDKLELQPTTRIGKLEDLLQQLEENQVKCQEQAETLHNYSDLMTQIKQDIARIKSKIISKYKKLVNSEVKHRNDIQDILIPKEMEVANALYINPKLILVLDDIAASLDL